MKFFVMIAWSGFRVNLSLMIVCGAVKNAVYMNLEKENRNSMEATHITKDEAIPVIGEFVYGMLKNMEEEALDGLMTTITVNDREFQVTVETVPVDGLESCIVEKEGV